MVEIVGTTITMTRGDTLDVPVKIMKNDGTEYEIQSGDQVRFAMKKKYDDANPLIMKTLDNEDLRIVVEPLETSQLDYGDYVYDVKLIKENGEKDTFINMAKIVITREVYL